MKSVIVIDTPKNCLNCPARYDSYGMEDICALADDIIYNCSSKPDWCPLLPLPEKLKGNDSIYYQWGDYEDGYNACIDDILGGK